MVDISTAMAAARADRAGRRKGDGDKKSRSGRNHGIEPFDPVKHVSKERADMFSMWLVILFSIVVSLMMRYAVMPSFDGGGDNDLLWFLPMALILLIPHLHRLVMPEPFHEHYGKGTWFRASFLHVFTWLALTFLLTNPPLGDIGAPESAAGWTVVSLQGDELVMTTDDLDSSSEIEFHLAEGEARLKGEIWLLFGLRDNADTSQASIQGTLTHFNGSSVNLSITDDRHENLSSWMSSMHSENEDLAFPSMTPLSTDVGKAIKLSADGLGVGVHVIELTFSEDGDPWFNERTYEWKVVVKEYVPPSED